MVFYREDVLYIDFQKLLKVIYEARTGWDDSSEISPKDLLSGRKNRKRAVGTMVH